MEPAEDGRAPLMPLKPLRAVIFDLDDTLVLSTVDFPKFKRLVIEEIVSLGEDRALYDPAETIVKILERFERRMTDRGLQETEIKAVLARLDRIMDTVELERVDETEALPGATETLTFLRARGVKIGILTRGCATYASRALARTRLEGLADALECRNSDTRPKPDPESYLRLVAALGVDKDQTVFVGDHPIDAQCALNAGVPFIGVTTGDIREQEFKKSGSYIVVRDVGELRSHLEPLLGD